MNKKIELPKMITAKITKVITENYRIKTFYIDAKLDAKPGQFVMVWIPGRGKKPFSLGGCDPVILTVAAVGPFTNKLCELKERDEISFHGPHGNDFTFQDKKSIVMVGGGYGVVPMYYISKEAKPLGVNCTMITGARNEKDLIYENYFNELGTDLHLSTNDGSKGMKGLVTDVLEDLLKQGKKFDMLYACGPNPMMVALAKVCDKYNVPYQFSVEAYMACGIGICGTCTVGDKIVCVDGTVFEKPALCEMGFLDCKNKEKEN